jgi:putative transposase
VYDVMKPWDGATAIFLGDQDQAFLDTLAEAHGLWGIAAFGYCLMRNHYHVCLRTPKGNLSRAMRHDT